MRRIRLVLDCGSLTHPTAETIDRLACLQLAARRSGGRLELEGAQPCLLELIDFCGLSEVLRVQVEGQAEEGEDPRRVQEEGELPDPAA
jgi:hypothetical protein